MNENNHGISGKPRIFKQPMSYEDGQDMLQQQQKQPATTITTSSTIISAVPVQRQIQFPRLNWNAGNEKEYFRRI